MSADAASILALLGLPGVGAATVRHVVVAAHATGEPLDELLGQVWSGANDTNYIYQNAIAVRDFWIANLNQ